MKVMKQFRYYGENSSNNYPNGLVAEDLYSDNIFSGLGSITQLGIQGRPGTIIFLNGQEYPIILGETGIYEIDLQDRGQIYSIQFEKSQLIDKAIYPGSLDSNRLLIDIIYERMDI